jgi:hypothetical protein
MTCAKSSSAISVSPDVSRQQFIYEGEYLLGGTSIVRVRPLIAKRLIEIANGETGAGCHLPWRPVRVTISNVSELGAYALEAWA